MEAKTVYVAEDGQQFDNEQECHTHDARCKFSEVLRKRCTATPRIMAGDSQYKNREVTAVWLIENRVKVEALYVDLDERTGNPRG